MEPRLSVSVRFGSGAGRLVWLADRCTFSIRLRFDDLDGVWAAVAFDSPPSPVAPSVDGPHLVVGDRPGQFITADRLLNQLRLYGLEPDAPSRQALPGFRLLVSRTFGDAEIVGFADPDRCRLLVALPDGRTIEIGTELNHPAHRFGWGPRSGSATSTMATARALVMRCWSPAWGADEEMLAQSLARCHLGRCGPLFSINANSLCDWYLFDKDLSTGLEPSQLANLTRSLS
ncbi:MAG: hypothetical protein WBM50_22435 [Acidimicrobiales bacterium]